MGQGKKFLVLLPLGDDKHKHRATTNTSCCLTTEKLSK